MMISIKELFENLPYLSMVKENTEISGISYNTKDIDPGDIFVCLKGQNSDGHSFIDEALKKRAKALVVSHKKYIPKGISGVVVSDTRKTLAEISNKFYDYPGNDIKLIGITGTNGKTTTSTVVHEILTRSGIKSGLIGTMNWIVGEETHKSIHTTPQAVELQSMLRQMVDSDVETTVMEVSSHALSLDRVTGCKYDIVAYTNLTQDHLDFHKNMDEYLNAKMRLFTDKTLHKDDAVAVINIDDPYSCVFLENFSGKKYTYGISNGDFCAENIEMTSTGSSFKVICIKEELDIKLKLIGKFNIYNALLAIAICYLNGIELRKIAKIIAGIEPVDGRFQVVQADKKRKKMPTVIVDYAHTPDGLEKILETAYNIAPGRVNLIFGCGGDRDRAKRPKMANIAAKYASKIIVTSDNPRTENPIDIIDEVLSGFCVEEMTKVEAVLDREEAINKMIIESEEMDVIIIAGKGHEDYQIFADRTIHFDDREVAKKALNNYK